MKKDLLTIQELTREEIHALMDRAFRMKRDGRRVERSLTGYTLGLIFDKASTRTRVSFETAMFRMGGQALFLNRGDTQMSRHETVADTMKALSRYLDALVVRTYSHGIVEEMAHFATIPVINGLTDLYHPCQVLSDLMTVVEKRGSLDRLKIVWIGDGNNVAHSWIRAAQILGFQLTLACPPNYQPRAGVLEGGGSNIRVVHDPRVAAQGADILNTDVWASMGQEDERQERLRQFQGFQVNRSLLELAKPEVLVMHCLPAHRGEEITDEVLDGPHSIVFDQAENKLYLHQALLEYLLVG